MIPACGAAGSTKDCAGGICAIMAAKAAHSMARPTWAGWALPMIRHRKVHGGNLNQGDQKKKPNPRTKLKKGSMKRKLFDFTGGLYI